MSEPRTDTFPSPVPPGTDTWYYPPDLADDMKDVHYISADVKAQLLTSAWEAVRSGTPHYTNWERYLAFVRIYIVAFFCDFSGQAVDLLASDKILGYSVSALLDILFEDMPQSVRESMQREVRCALFFQAEKSSNRRNGELFRRYANSLAQSPRQWFRMRSCDGMARFSMMAALACNDILDVFFSEEQWEVLGEIVWTMYDAVAFYKHRSEGEVCNTFAYMPEMRIKSFWLCREVLWALDTAWAREASLIPVLNNLRLLGGTVHMMMRRYTFVEDQLSSGNSFWSDADRADVSRVECHRDTSSTIATCSPIDSKLFLVRRRVLSSTKVSQYVHISVREKHGYGITQIPRVTADLKVLSVTPLGSLMLSLSRPLDLAWCFPLQPFAKDDTPQIAPILHARGNFKLWYRITASELKAISAEGIQHYKDVLDRREELLFPGLAAILETADDQRCDTCLYPDSYATEAPIHCFGGVQLCDACKPLWRDFLESLPERTAKAFPELVETYKKGIASTRVVE
ncbi:hypothetical protein K438DRAFT_1962341 [Mycena galopus ATCC 62051]|nr:hypothetical protein K438DRAFT_1962341 [Mycena galopus ATCC 62051]